MSIFRKTFTKSVQAQLKYRQDTVKSRTPQSIQLATSRTPWIRMTSGVNTFAGFDNDKDKNPIFDNTLAKQNILLGGVLGSDKKLKYSIGNTGNEAYSDRTPSGKQYQRGLRPMPGITSVDVKSKSAYGSLREVTVNFICHDIKQLEDLELLYMRPGYTVLVEWGWLPYVKTDGVLGIAPPQLKTNVDFYDDVLNGTKDFQTILLDLFKKSRDMHSGNYDAVYGKIQNYSWQARMDGGYDCTTTIITMGEILESLKINTTPFNINKIVEDELCKMNDWDIFSLGCGMNKHYPNIFKNKHIYRAKEIRCADSLIVSSRGMKTLVDSIPILKLPIDEHYDLLIKSNKINILWLEPTLVLQGSQIGFNPTTIRYTDSIYVNPHEYKWLQNAIK